MQQMVTRWHAAVEPGAGLCVGAENLGLLVMQRVNGRLAMLAFVAGVVAERVGHKSIIEQAGQATTSVLFFMILISAASIIPKYSSGTSLKVCHQPPLLSSPSLPSTQCDVLQIDTLVRG